MACAGPGRREARRRPPGRRGSCRLWRQRPVHGLRPEVSAADGRRHAPTYRPSPPPAPCACGTAANAARGHRGLRRSLVQLELAQREPAAAPARGARRWAVCRPIASRRAARHVGPDAPASPAGAVGNGRDGGRAATSAHGVRGGCHPREELHARRRGRRRRALPRLPRARETRPSRVARAVLAPPAVMASPVRRLGSLAERGPARRVTSPNA